MSKNFGGRRSDKVAYTNRHSDDKRPSVFERLGVRRDNAGSHYSAENSETKRNETGKTSSKMSHSEVGTKRTRVSHGREPTRGRSKSRSPPTPKQKKKSVAVHQRKGKQKSSGSGRINKQISRASAASPSRREITKSKSKQQRDNPKNKAKTQKKSKKVVEKSRQKARSSSVSSEDSSTAADSSTSTTSRSRSSSSSHSEASSTSSSPASSSSESSVPSVKLKPDRKEKTKKSKKKNIVREKVKLQSSNKRKNVPSSGSSIESPNFGAKVTSQAKISKTAAWAGHRGSRDKRLPKEITSPVLEVSRPSKVNDRLERNDRMRREQVESRKRKISEDSYHSESVIKKTRVISPHQDKYKPVARTALSTRRVPSMEPPLSKPKRDRSPVEPRDRIRIIRSPLRRPSYEEPRRLEPKHEVNKRVSTPFMKSKDVERDRIYPTSSAPTDRYEKLAGYRMQDGNRPRERFAPARPPLLSARGRPLTPEHERERLKDRPKTFEMRSKPQPLPLLTSFPLIPERHPGGYKPRIIEEGRHKIFSGEPPKRHSPLIVKTKQELMEKYDEIKQSRVDMWVDETLKGPKHGECITEKYLPPMKLLIDPRRISDEPKGKCSSIGSLGMDKVKVDLNESVEQFSDFSDDAEEILNKAPESKILDDPIIPVNTKESWENDECNVDIPKPTLFEVSPPIAEIKVEPEEATITVVKDSPLFITQQHMVLPTSGDDPSLRSHSQTDDDILERMDFEEISDEELGEVENRIKIVDALGVDWSSLVCREKNTFDSPSSYSSTPSTAVVKVRERWTPLQILKQVGVSKQLCGDKLFNRLNEVSENIKGSFREDFQNPMQRQKQFERNSLLDNYGLGPNSRALSARRDMAVRRYLMGIPPKSLMSLDVLHQTQTSIVPQEQSSANNLYRMSVILFKNSQKSAVSSV